MKYSVIGQTGINASILSLGTWGLGGGTSWSNTDDNHSVDIIHRASDLGINLVDTAPVYGMGHSEEVVGRALQGCRSNYILATKCAMQWRNENGVKMYNRDGHTIYKYFAPSSLRADLEGSLKRLNTDYIDIYFTHRQPDDISQVAEVLETLQKFKEEGKIRAIGISNASANHLKEYLKWGRIDVVQEKYSLLDFNHHSEYIPACIDNGVTFQAFSVLERGLLTGKIGMDYELQTGEARKSIKWFKPEYRIRVLQLLEQWKGLCEKYNCSMTNLVMASTLHTAQNFNALFGVRRIENLEDTVKAIEIVLSEDDYSFVINSRNETLNSIN